MILTSLMPGLMQDLPGPGKLKSAAGVATAESRAQYFAFETAVLQAAFEFKRAYFNLYFLEERLRINRRTLTLLTDLEGSARAQNEVGQASLQDVYRAQIDREQLRTEIANLEDSRGMLLAGYKAALGLTRGQADPPLPAPFAETPLDLTGDELLKVALANNPRLQEASPRWRWRRRPWRRRASRGCRIFPPDCRRRGMNHRFTGRRRA